MAPDLNLDLLNLRARLPECLRWMSYPNLWDGHNDIALALIKEFVL